MHNAGGGGNVKARLLLFKGRFIETKNRQTRQSTNGRKKTQGKQVMQTGNRKTQTGRSFD